MGYSKTQILELKKQKKQKQKQTTTTKKKKNPHPIKTTSLSQTLQNKNPNLYTKYPNSIFQNPRRTKKKKKKKKKRNLSYKHVDQTLNITHILQAKYTKTI